MVMLNLFARLQADWRLELTVLHVNHSLRDEESDADERVVLTTAEEMGIPFISHRVNVKKTAAEKRLSIETAARELRYAFFDQFAKKHNCRVATAHTANDQAETVLANMMRGAGISGLRGIPIRRDVYIRPLLFAERSALLSYAEENQVQYRHDRTNTDLAFQRNRIRHTLLPMIQEQFNPQIVTSLNRLAETADESERLLNDYAELAFKNCLRVADEQKIVLDIHQFLAYLKSLQRLVLGHVFHHLTGNLWLPGYQKLENILDFVNKKSSGSRFSISEEIELLITSDTLVLSNIQPEFADQSIPWAPGVYEFGDGRFLEIIKTDKPLPLRSNSRFSEQVDADRVSGRVSVGSARPGDYFYPINGSGRKKISDFFIDLKVPFYKRSTIPILRCDTGIIWICGYRLDERFKITETTRRIYQLKLRQS